jgi:integrase
VMTAQLHANVHAAEPTVQPGVLSNPKPSSTTPWLRIAVVLGVTGRIYRFAARRLGWTGTNPTTLMLASERPKVSLAKRRPIFTPEQIEQIIAAAGEPYRTMFTVAALTGARMSELCGLTWSDARLEDVDDAELTFGWQVDRKGNRRPTKTDGSARTVPIPRELAVLFARHKLVSPNNKPGHPHGLRSRDRGCSTSPLCQCGGRPWLPNTAVCFGSLWIATADRRPDAVPGSEAEFGQSRLQFLA